MNCNRHGQHVRPLVPFTALIALAAAVVPLLLGCGGDASSAGAAAVPAEATPAPRATTGAEPDDAGARTRQGRYLTGEQAQALARRLDDRLVIVQAQCCGYEAAELDALVAFAVQAAVDLPRDAPFVVSGGDLRQAAAVANRLAELGAVEVHLVTR